MNVIGNIFSRMRELWTLTHFEGRDMSVYAESMMFSDASRGVRTLGLVSMFLLFFSALTYAVLGFEMVYVHSALILAVLSLHVAVSAGAVRETRALYMLATTLVVVSGVAFVLLAHYSQNLNASLFAGVMLLFLVMPLVPWGLREAILIVLLVYSLFTLSTLSVEGRFDSRTLWMLQLMMLAGGATTLVVVARNALIRRDDIRSRYALEQAHDRMEILSLKDPLTGAWNRRFLEQRFERIRGRAIQKGDGLQLALIDVDDFKQINDTCGHDFGDAVLCRLVDSFSGEMGHDDHLIRFGGDEFLLVMSHADTANRIARAVGRLSEASELANGDGKCDYRVGVSVGLVRDGEKGGQLDDLCRACDKALYRAKAEKGEQRRNSIRVYEDLGNEDACVA